MLVGECIHCLLVHVLSAQEAQSLGLAGNH